MTFLLDVNVLIALIDPGHVAHEDAHEWFGSIGAAGWAACPMTENGLLRIVGNPKYPNSPGSPAVVAKILRRLRALPGYRFWPDDLSLIGADTVAPEKILTSGQVTDTYLLALAQTHGGQLATFDRKLSSAAVKHGKLALYLISGKQSD